MSTYNPYTVSAMEMAGLLWWNAGNEVQLRWISRTKRFEIVRRTLTGKDEWYGRIQDIRSNGPDKRDVLAAVQGSASTSICIIPRTHGVSQTKASKMLYHCGFSPLSKSTTLVSRSCQPSMILWMAATLATNSAWHSVRAWGSVRSDGITNTRNWHTRTQEKPHEVVRCWFKHPFSVAVWCGGLGNNLMKQMSPRGT